MTFDLTSCFLPEPTRPAVEVVRSTAATKQAKNAARDSVVIAWAKQGLTYKDIGDRLGVKRQRVKQILDRLRAAGNDVPVPMVVRQDVRRKNLRVTTLNSNSPAAKEAVANGADPRTVAALMDYIRHKRANAKRIGVPFDLTFADVWPLPTTCPALGIPISLFAEHRDNAVSFDQLQPKKGYTKGNVVVVSYRANRIKNDATPKELRDIAEFFSSLTYE